jgi:hypothetical protein
LKDGTIAPSPKINRKNQIFSKHLSLKLENDELMWTMNEWMIGFNFGVWREEQKVDIGLTINEMRKQEPTEAGEGVENHIGKDGLENKLSSAMISAIS